MATILTEMRTLPAPVNSPSGNPAREPLTKLERIAVAFLVVIILAYGVLVVIRSAFVDRPYTDLGCFLHAAWAVRTGNDIYTITFNGWYYCYPPLLAILMVPLALPPAGEDASWMLPLSITSGLWYLLNVVFVAWGVHRLAGALEEKAGGGIEAGSRQWWMLRTAPIWATLISIGSAQGHGQTNLLLLALVCAMIAAFLRGGSLQAGLWLAGAICVKVFPAYLLIYPLWRRDFRCLAGCGVGLMVGLVAIPTATFGPAKMWEYNRRFVLLVIAPSLSDKADKARAETLTNITATDTQSFMAMMHNTMHLDRATRPDQVSPTVFRLHLLIAGALTLLTLYAGGWQRRSATQETMFLGMLLVIMMLTSPVCHLHYFPWLIPLIMALVQWQWQRGAALYLGLGWSILFAVNNAVHIMAHLREYAPMQMVRDLCLCSYVALTIWLLGWVYLKRDQELASRAP